MSVVLHRKSGSFRRKMRRRFGEWGARNAPRWVPRGVGIIRSLDPHRFRPLTKARPLKRGSNEGTEGSQARCERPRTHHWPAGLGVCHRPPPGSLTCCLPACRKPHVRLWAGYAPGAAVASTTASRGAFTRPLSGGEAPSFVTSQALDRPWPGPLALLRKAALRKAAGRNCSWFHVLRARLGVSGRHVLT